MGFNFATFKKTFWLFTSQYILKSKSAKVRCLIAALLILVDVAAATLVPYATKIIVEDLTHTLYHTLWIALILLGLFWTLEKTVNHLQEIIFFPAINLTIRNLSYNLINHLHHISLPTYKTFSIPEVINCIRRISLSARAFIKIIFLMIVPVTLKLTIALYLVTKIGLLGWILLPAIVVSIFLLYLGTKWYTTAREVAWQTSDRVTMRISDSLLNTKMVRPFKIYELEQLGPLLDTEAKLWHTANTRLHAIYIVIGGLLGITITAILAGTILAIQKGTLSVGDFVLIKGQLIASFLPFRLFAVEFRQMAESIVDIKKIIALFEIPEEPTLISEHPPASFSQNEIVLKNVSFRYDKHHDIFKSLSLHFPLGNKIAILGESGCGKSTFINLIASFYKPTQGYITIDSPNKQKILCLPQEYRLFNLSLRDNITYGLSNLTDKEIFAAAEKIGISEFISTLPNGLETIVGEMGIKLSGGEKQKVALLRALLFKPTLLLLDETTSALSPETEKRILSVLFANIPSIIIASHRTTLLPLVDKIYKIVQGKFVELNKHHENIHSKTLESEITV